jgi:hypothetical protein
MTGKSDAPALTGYDQSLGVGMPPFFRLLCYDYIPDIDRLEASLAKVFERYPRFAQRVVGSTKGNAQFVAMEQPQRLELRPPVRWTHDDFAVEQLPAFVSGLESAPGQPVAAARLRPITGGAALSVSLSHSAGDFYSLYLFLATWAEQFKAAAAGARDPSVVPPLNQPPIAIEDSEELRQQSPSKLRSTGLHKHNYSLLHFDREFLDSLRSELSSDKGPLSLNEVLTAFIIHRHGKAIMGRTSGLRLRVPVNVRGVHPAIPNDFVGNGITEAVVPLDELVDSPAAARQTAQRIRDSVEAVRTREAVEAALEVVDGQVELRTKGLPVYNRHTDILSTNLSKMPWHKLDFGKGPPQKFLGTHTGYNGISISTVADGLEVRVFSEHGSVSAA